MNVLVRGDARYRGFVHIDRFGYVAKDHGAQESHAFFEELALFFHDAFGDPNDCLSALLDSADEPLRAPKLLADEIFADGSRSSFFASDSLIYRRCIPRSLSKTTNRSPSLMT